MDDESVEIDWRELADETLERLLSEIVTRDGTDYGFNETETSARIRTALAALQQGHARLFWNLESETAALLSASEFEGWQSAMRRQANQIGMSSSASNTQDRAAEPEQAYTVDSDDSDRL